MEIRTVAIKGASQMLEPVRVERAIVVYRRRLIVILSKRFYILSVCACMLLSQADCFAQSKNVIEISGTSFTINGKPFEYTGVSFFNAIYNPTFNSSAAERSKWLAKFQEYGINVLRVWGQ